MRKVDVAESLSNNLQGEMKRFIVVLKQIVQCSYHAKATK